MKNQIEKKSNLYLLYRCYLHAYTLLYLLCILCISFHLSSFISFCFLLPRISLYLPLTLEYKIHPSEIFHPFLTFSHFALYQREFFLIIYIFINFGIMASWWMMVCDLWGFDVRSLISTMCVCAWIKYTPNFFSVLFLKYKHY